jgi:hypothetical protein
VPKRNKDQDEKGYEVGYAKPPKHSRFKAGESGNPNGRPSGTPNFATVLLRTLRERVVINENGKRNVVTKLEAAVKQLVNKSASGDMRAMNQLFGLARIAEESVAGEMTPNEIISELDHKVMLGMLKRYEEATKGEK